MSLSMAKKLEAEDGQRRQTYRGTLPLPSIDPRDINHYGQFLSAKSICMVH